MMNICLGVSIVVFENALRILVTGITVDKSYIFSGESASLHNEAIEQSVRSTSGHESDQLKAANPPTSDFTDDENLSDSEDEYAQTPDSTSQYGSSTVVFFHFNLE